MKTAPPLTATPLVALAQVLVLSLAAGTATAHDTWFATLPAMPGRPGAALLALGTGNQYPRQESGIDAHYLVSRGCRAAGPQAARAAPLALKALRNTPTSLVLQAPNQAATCWAQLTPFEVELAPDKVPVYLQDIQATQAIRETWAAMQARGLSWRERYVKHARIELGTPSMAPVAMDLDVALDTAGQPVRVGVPFSALALRDGQPLAGLALELRSEDSPLGIWRRTDAQGRITVAAPLPGRWVLRGVDLRVSATDPDRWDSRFVTLAFDVAPATAAPAAASTAAAPAPVSTATPD
jgi:hypothetical protein